MRLIKIVLMFVLGNKHFLEALFSWIFFRLLKLLDKRLKKSVGPNANLQPVEDLVKTVNRIQKSLDVVKVLMDAMIYQKGIRNQEKVLKLPRKTGVSKSVKRISKGEMIKVGLNTLNAWGKKKNTPQEYIDYNKYF